jgi:phosphoglycerate dehydrogenase-like enzyme
MFLKNIMLILAVCRKIPLGHISTLKGSWERLAGRGVYKRSIGIIGVGRIRKAVAEEILAHGVKKDEIFSQPFIMNLRSEVRCSP